MTISKCLCYLYCFLFNFLFFPMYFCSLHFLYLMLSLHLWFTRVFHLCRVICPTLMCPISSTLLAYLRSLCSLRPCQIIACSWYLLFSPFLMISYFFWVCLLVSDPWTVALWIAFTVLTSARLFVCEVWKPCKILNCLPMGMHWCHKHWGSVCGICEEVISVYL